MNAGTHLILMTFTLLNLSPFADALPWAKGGFDVYHFICSRRDGKLLSQIHFFRDQNRKLVGELDIYETKGPNRTFVSGEVLYAPVFSDGTISGTTGDPEGLTELFRLRRLGGRNGGRWHYDSDAGGREMLRGDFNCNYPDQPYSGSLNAE